MNRTTLRLEVLLLLRSRQVLAVTLTTLALFSVALLQGWATRQRIESQVAAARQDEAERLASLRRMLADPPQIIGFQDPTRTGSIGRSSGATIAARKSTSLSILFPGLSLLATPYFRISTESRVAVLTQETLENPTALATGSFDFGFALLVVYPLLIGAICYDLFAGDRESGRLSLLLAYASRPRDLLWMRVLPRAVLLLGLPLIAMLAGWLLGGAGDGLRFVLLSGAVLLYCAFWIALALLLNLFPLTRNGTALAYAAVWAVLVLALPQAIQVAAEARYPTPSRVELAESVRVATREAAEQGSLLLAQFLDQNPQLDMSGMDPSDLLTRSTAVQAEVDRLMQPLLAAHASQLESQQRFVEAASWASPATLLHVLATGLAGTDLGAQEWFTAQVTRFHEQWDAYFLPRTITRERMRPEQVAEIPKFRYVEEGLLGLSRYTAPALGLLAWMILLASLTATKRLR